MPVIYRFTYRNYPVAVHQDDGVVNYEITRKDGTTYRDRWNPREYIDSLVEEDGIAQMQAQRKASGTTDRALLAQARKRGLIGTKPKPPIITLPGLDLGDGLVIRSVTGSVIGKWSNRHDVVIHEVRGAFRSKTYGRGRGSIHYLRTDKGKVPLWNLHITVTDPSLLNLDPKKEARDAAKEALDRALGHAVCLSDAEVTVLGNRLIINTERRQFVVPLDTDKNGMPGLYLAHEKGQPVQFTDLWALLETNINCGRIVAQHLDIPVVTLEYRDYACLDQDQVSNLRLLHTQFKDAHAEYSRAVETLDLRQRILNIYEKALDQYEEDLDTWEYTKMEILDA